MRVQALALPWAAAARSTVDRGTAVILMSLPVSAQDSVLAVQPNTAASPELHSRLTVFAACSMVLCCCGWQKHCSLGLPGRVSTRGE
jgi:hypothetical protein